MRNASLTISIVLHDSALDNLGATLRSLIVSVAKASEAGVLGSAALVVLDNGSTAPYKQALPAFLDSQLAGSQATLSFRLVMQADNPGFGEGHNRALTEADGELLLILNPDVELAPDALLQALTVFGAQDHVVAVNPLCEGSDGRREYLCKRYPTLFDLFLRGAGPESLLRYFRVRLAHYEYRDLSDAQGPQPVRLLSGACLFCRRDAFSRVGGFDPAYFLYFEDFDLSLRLAELGSLLYLPQMQIVHRGGYAARKGRQHVRWFISSAGRFFSRNGWRFF
ncbi:MAG: glycosyltransferase [Congregibacter sp.]